MSFDPYLGLDKIRSSNNSGAQLSRSTLIFNTFTFTRCESVPAVGTAEAGLQGCTAKFVGDNKEGQCHGVGWPWEVARETGGVLRHKDSRKRMLEQQNGVEK
jgi:hypothetical protein